MRAAPEQILQRQVFEFLTVALSPPAWFTSIPAGGGGRVRGAILKATGYKPGSPDILIVYNGRAYFLELKAPKTGRVSPAQWETHHLLTAAGCPVATCRSLDEVMALFGPKGPWWPIPVRIARQPEAAE
jgi:VRR-NUC domain-containing protein